MTKKIAGMLLGAAALALAGCSSHRDVYYAAPPPPPMYGQPPLVHAAETNGFSDGERQGQRDRFQGHSYRPQHSDRYEDAPGYYAELGGTHDQYRYYYRDGFVRGYHYGYTHA
jgi:hypothetical protein